MAAGLVPAVAGVVLAGLSFVLSGVLSRPLLVAGVLLFLQAGIGASRPARRVIRVWAQANTAIAVLLGLVVVGGVGFWATQPFFHRRTALATITAFSEEGRRLEADLVNRTRASGPLSDMTSRVKDWHQRFDQWVGEDLGTFYQARVGAPQSAATYPPDLHPNLRVFWDVVESDLGTLTLFHTELSHWLF